MPPTEPGDDPEVDALTDEYNAWREEQGLEPDFLAWLLFGRLEEEAAAWGVIFPFIGDDDDD